MTTSRAVPPFRADHVGSLLRPKVLQEARAEWKAGTLTQDALREVEDTVHRRRHSKAGGNRSSCRH